MPLTERIQTLTVEVQKHDPESFAKTFGFMQGGLTGLIRHELDDATAEALNGLLEVAWVAFMKENSKR